MNTYALSEIPNIKTHGRVSEKSPFTFLWASSGIEMNMKASGLRLKLFCDYDSFEPWITVEINGAFINRVRLEKGENDICIFRNMDRSRVLNVKILRDNQPFSGKSDILTFTSLETDGEFLPVEDRKLKLEFIGDSITTGEGTIGARKDYEFITMFMSNYNAYPRMIQRRLDADIQVISQCGWGVVSGWDNNPYCSIPLRYNEVCSVMAKDGAAKDFAHDPYDFDKFTPDAVIINLGTNDNTAFGYKEWSWNGETFKQHKDSPEDIKRFKDAVIAFLKNVRSKRKDAHIVWAFGILPAQFTEENIRSAVDEYISESGDRNMEFLKLDAMGSDDYGSRSHPGIPAHKNTADRLCDYLKDVLKSD